jgi:cell division protease FtsH
MATEYGMSDRLGAIKLGRDQNEVFLGRDMGHMRDYSEEVAAAIDSEVRRFVDEAHDEAFEILVTYRDVLDELVLQLLEKETLTKDQVLEIFAPVRKRPSRGVWRGNGSKRMPSDRPPVLTPAERAMLDNGGAVTRRRAANGNGDKPAAKAGVRRTASRAKPVRRVPRPRTDS